ncbi:hypothetical protein NX963_004399 [Salmonella enterica]|nr:hypothetical protein [Salmonella enterica]EIQ3693448.1 hypothetical protein [Salmonella enterica]EJK9765999.1 hypothetical protein [Salmonella enterica]EJQ3119099.1 hypothetical protein [Salmonella enterica]EJY7395562.1 hypothetical protein [Salmonella enterica]
MPEIIPASSHLLITSAFYLTGYGLHLPQGICCRVSVKLHQKRNVLSTAPEPVRHFNRGKRESDARSLFDLHQINQLRQLLAGF